MRGAKNLRKSGNPYFILNTIRDLAEVPLGLKSCDFPKILVGSHAANAEIVLRQILLREYVKLCAVIMQSIGSGDPVAAPIPPAWVDHLVANGINCSPFLCRVLLYIAAIKRKAIGMAKFLYSAVQIKGSKYPDCPYVVFLDLQQNSLPGYNRVKKTRDIITWYKESIIRRQDVKKIWVQAKVDDDYEAPDDLIVSRVLFPRFNSFSACLHYYSNVVAAFFFHY